MKLAQCWDDGVVDDIRVIEILRRHGAKASFNLNLGLHLENRYAGWKYQNTKEVWKLASQELVQVYDGFLVANHSLNHPCLNKIPAAEAEREIREGKDALEQLFGYAVKGFAYPFGVHNEAIEEMIRSTGHVYARTTGVTDKVFPPANPMAFHPHCHFQDPLFWEKFERARQVDGVFYFWGHSYEIITEEQWQAFEQTIARLSAQSATWVDLPDLFEKPAGM
jgi:peptidoglycan/xylan/chitin deacetylase (PgdA/CDA1 family)